MSIKLYAEKRAVGGGFRVYWRSVVDGDDAGAANLPLVGLSKHWDKHPNGMLVNRCLFVVTDVASHDRHAGFHVDDAYATSYIQRVTADFEREVEAYYASKAPPVAAASSPFKPVSGFDSDGGFLDGSLEPYKG